MLTALVKLNIYGEMAERSNAAVLKTVDGQLSGGSNPSLSAIRELYDTRQSEFVLFLLYESFGVSITIKDILPKPPITTAWQTQKRDENGNFTK